MPGYWDLFVIRHLRRLGIPVVTIVHDAANHPGDRLQLIHHMQRLMIKESTAIVTLTDFVTRCLNDQDRIGGRAHRTIAHPALTFPDLDLPQPEAPGYPDREPLRLLLTGRLRKYKGMDLFLKALAMIDPARLDVRITGAINDKPSLKNVKAHVNVALENGWMSEQEFVSHLNWCDVVVLPYREASQSGIIPAAFARQRPVIVTPVGGLPEQVRHETTGLVTGNVSGEAIAKAVQRLIDAPDLLSNMADNAYGQARNELSANEIGSRFVEFLSGVSRVVQV